MFQKVYCSSIPGNVHYSLVTSVVAPLTIDYSTGEITLRDKLDASFSPMTIVVRAKDGAQPALSSTVPLTITVIDINDHVKSYCLRVSDGCSSNQHSLPRRNLFSSTKMYLSVRKSVESMRLMRITERMEEWSKIIRTRCYGHIIKFRYSMISCDDFVIDATTGAIRAIKMLDRERNAKYSCEVCCASTQMYANTIDRSRLLMPVSLQ